MRRLGTVLLHAALLLAVAGCGDDDAPAAAPPPAGPTAFRVMTQNLYLGGELDAALAAGADLPRAVERIWSSVQATDFGERAKLVAAAIEAADPDLVGLQEVSLWRTQTPGDRLIFPNATAVAYDFLEILLRELAARGLSYRAVATVQNGDVELSGESGTDYRLTDRDAILAKASLPVLSSASGTFAHLAQLTLPSPTGGPAIRASIPRGWVMAEFRAGGRTVRLVNAHLEAVSEEVAAQQASELVAVANPAAQPTVVLGDMNLTPGSPGYGSFVAAGTRLADTWTAQHAGDPGLTCCWAPDLRSGGYDKRIDLVFATGDLRATSAAKVNETERTPGGVAPSDHAGVVVGIDAPATTPTPLAAAAAR